ncbi:MAG: uracil permease [Firmicutes bacterium]|mgnify:CR=1 FL=1|nr:uracil permease [Bacillota bacterium]
MEQPKIGVHEKLPLVQMIPLGFQHLFAMFGATILVPLLVNGSTGMMVIPPGVALLTAGAGTLLFLAITQFKVPAYLGSSFAFIAPLIAVASQFGPGHALGGAVAVGILYALIALIIRQVGVDWLDRALPPVVIGSVIVVIGLGLAGTGVDMAGLSGDVVSLANVDVRISLFTLAVAIAASVWFKGFLAVIPILIGVVSGYLFALLQGAVDLTPVKEAAWFALPVGNKVAFSWPAIATILPVGLVTIAEHLGDVLVLSRVVDRDFYREPGLHRTILGDGLATLLAGFLGGPPNTTYGENIGVMAITGVYSVWVIATAAIMAVLLSFMQKFGALIQTIPEPVMGGICIMLFGVIASSGIRTLVESGIDFGDKRNLIIASVILVLGIGGARLQLGAFALEGMALAAVVGILLNLVLPGLINSNNATTKLSSADSNSV